MLLVRSSGVSLYGLRRLLPVHKLWAGQRVDLVPFQALQDASLTAAATGENESGSITCVGEHLLGASGAGYTVVGRNDGSFEIFSAE